MKKIILPVFALLLAAPPAFPWGGEGHQTIAAIAAPLLNAKAQAAVTAILGSETLVDAAVWPDEIKTPWGILHATPDAVAFNHKHPDNKTWHFVNFPVGAKSYSATSPFAYPHDIVHIINGCITVLEGGEYEGLTSKEALRYLVHLVGDVHQPLHTIAGYYDLSDPAHPLLEKPSASIDRNTGDSGGNDLVYGKAEELHACWDTVLVGDVYPTTDPQVLATQIMTGVAPDKFKTAGKYQNWGAKWAGDSMKLAITAYADIEFGQATVNPHGDLQSMAVQLKPSTTDYRAKFAPVVKEQLQKAGLHLAQLLNSLEWDATP
jgi:nuclease S1